MTLEEVAAKIRVVPDFPKPGISFKDITPILKDPEAFRCAVDALAERCAGIDFECIAAPEARGFIIGSALAYKMGKGFVPVRKPGKLPWKTVSGRYALEYGNDSLEMHLDAVAPGERVLVLDDVLATGGTISATIDMVKKLGGTVAAVAFLVELSYINGRENLKDYLVVSAIELKE
ncbi:MAG TPA: adenine phosphoribosyltransferase [Firmicutes bacterium]|nr:adenine phosphoribosyltransferase [Bacillota bacterium]